MIVVLMGVTGSGKTTVGKILASQLNWKFYDADDYHPAANIEKMCRGIPLTDEDRKPWLQTLARLIDDAQDRGENIVLGCSALKHAYQEYLRHHLDVVQYVCLCGPEESIRTWVPCLDDLACVGSNNARRADYDSIPTPVLGLVQSKVSSGHQNRGIDILPGLYCGDTQTNRYEPGSQRSTMRQPPLLDCRPHAFGNLVYGAQRCFRQEHSEFLPAVAANQVARTTNVFLERLGYEP